MSEYQTQESLGVLLGGRVGEIGLLGMRSSPNPPPAHCSSMKSRSRIRACSMSFYKCSMPPASRWRAEKRLDLSGFYIVFTSNIAAAEIINLQHSSFATMERHVLAKAQRTLRPELYARITEKLVFNRLSYDVQMEIARLHIARELSFLRDKGFDLTLGPFRRVIPHATRLSSATRSASLARHD